MRLARINLKYEKDDLQMKSHMMTSMSDDYRSVIINFRGDLNETSLAKLRKEVVLQFKALIKGGGGGTGSESVLSANMSKHPYKKFKGTCRNCGKIGHKANKCRSAKVEATVGATTGASTTNGDKSHVTCFNCQNKGHFANKCTFPKKLKSEANTDMGMFVGVTISDTAEDTHNTFGSYGFENFFDNFDDSVAFGDDDERCDLCPFWVWTLILWRIRSPYLLMSVRKTIRFTNMSQMLLQTFLSTNQNQSLLRRQAAKPTPLSIMTMSVWLLRPQEDRKKNGFWTPVLHAVSPTTRTI
jgi:hypothetical protein